MNEQQRIAMELALEALEWVVEQAGGPECEHESGGAVCFCKEKKAMTALREALAHKELEQELCPSCRNSSIYACTCTFKPTLAPKEPEQRSVSEHLEPVAYIGSDFQLLYCRNDWSKGLKVGDCLYTTPQPPQRKPLTDAQIEACMHHVNEDGIGLFAFARAIEAAHGIKE